MIDDPRDDPFDRGVDAGGLVDEIRALREAADRYVDAARASHGDVARLGLELERAAIGYAEKRTEQIRAATQVDYLAIVEAADRDRGVTQN